MIKYSRVTTENLSYDAAVELVTAASLDIGETKFHSHKCDFSIQSWMTAGLMLSVVATNSHSIKRTRPTILRGGIDSYRIRLCPGKTGMTLDDGQELVMQAGDIEIADMGQPATIYGAEGEMLYFFMPREVLEPLVNPGGVGSTMHGLAIRGNTAIGTMLGTHMRTLRELMPRLSPHELPSIVSSTIDLLAGGIACASELARPLAKAKPEVMLIEIKAHIVANLHDPELSPSSISRRFRVSRASLYEMFKPYSGVSTYIRTIRLRRCFQTLSDPRQKHRQISEIAFAAGFSNESHFSRVFRQAFGFSPREARSFPVRREVPENRPDSVGQDVFEQLRKITL